VVVLVVTSTTYAALPSSGMYANCVWTLSSRKKEAVRPCVVGKAPLPEFEG
jgi:hypothetical protein